MIDIQEIERWCSICTKRFREPVAQQVKTRFKLTLVTTQGEHAVYLCGDCEGRLADRIRPVNPASTDMKRPVTKAS